MYSLCKKEFVIPVWHCMAHLYIILSHLWTSRKLIIGVCILQIQPKASSVTIHCCKPVANRVPETMFIFLHFEKKKIITGNANIQGWEQSNYLTPPHPLLVLLMLAKLSNIDELPRYPGIFRCLRPRTTQTVFGLVIGVRSVYVTSSNDNTLSLALRYYGNRLNRRKTHC